MILNEKCNLLFVTICQYALGSNLAVYLVTSNMQHVQSANANALMMTNCLDACGLVKEWEGHKS